MGPCGGERGHVGLPGKDARAPVWKLLGSTVSRVPVYGSGGWLSYTIGELLGEVTEYRRRGFNAVKIKVGGGLERDLERLRKVREAVGPGLKIMMDANQGMSLQDALALSRKAEDLDIFWFEEPIDHRDYEGYAVLGAGPPYRWPWASGSTIPRL